MDSWIPIETWGTLWLIMTNRASHGKSMALIESSMVYLGLPNLKMVIFFPWRTVNVITRGYPGD